jgi:hypothetical protein
VIANDGGERRALTAEEIGISKSVVHRLKQRIEQEDEAETE